MRRILIDTNAYVAFKQGNPDIIGIFQHADTIGISVVVLGELIAGFTIGTKSKENLEDLNKFLDTPRIALFNVDENTTAFYATVYATLRKKGKPIPTNDLWIAATALQQGCKLCSFDKHFEYIDNVLVTTTLLEFLL
ncbi:MAG TPA: type II toxin-antitoxin system VapC family toxin [Gammaproteobacteria bacterium]|nr:type II toxin-antitoxin system VapC family toxin [Gammaproteobacteria bacterium]